MQTDDKSHSTQYSIKQSYLGQFAEETTETW